MTIIQKNAKDAETIGEKNALKRFHELGEKEELFQGNITFYRVYRKNGEVFIRKALSENWHDCKKLFLEAGTENARLI